MIGTPFGRRREVDIHKLGLWLVMALLALSAMRGYRTAFSEHGNDLTIFLRAARTAARGQSPYGDPEYLYLPVFSVLLRPLAALPMWLAVAIWQVASWAAILQSVRITARLVDPSRFQPWLGWASLTLGYRLADSGLSYGQANAFTLLLILVAIDLGRRGRWWLAAFTLGVAAAFKVLPAALFLALLFAGQWPAVVFGVLVFMSLATLLPWAALGPEMAWRVHGEWYEGVLAPYLAGGDALLARARFVPGHSLVAFGYHSLGDLPVSANDPDLRANFVDLSPGVIHWIVRAVVAMHLATLAALGLDTSRPRTVRRFMELAFLTMCTILLCAPIVHRAHFIWILPAVAFLLSIAAAAAPTREREVARIALTVSAALLGLTTSGIVGRASARWLTGHGVTTIAVEFIWLALVWILLLRRRSHPSIEPDHPDFAQSSAVGHGSIRKKA